MDLATLTLFLPACFALNMAPGPNNLLSVSNSTRYGYRTSCLAGVGRLLAFAGMIALASAGLAVVLQTSELLFYGIKILGAAYLFYLAYQLWRSNPHAEAESTAPKAGLWALARQEFLVAAGKPGDGQYKTSQKTTFGHLQALRHPANTHNSYGLAIVSNSKFVDGEFTLY